MFTTAQLLAALEAMPSRSVAILHARCIQGKSREHCAHAYGISPEAFDALLLGAANDLAHAIGAEPLAFAPQTAAQLAADFESTAPTEEIAHALRALRSHASALGPALEPVTDLVHVPVSAFEKWLRRLAIIAILLLTAYLYWQEKHPGFKILGPHRTAR